MKNHVSVACLALAIIIAAMGCKKNSSDTPTVKANCRLTGYHANISGGVGIYTFTYNSEGQVQTARVEKGGVSTQRTFTYRPGVIITAITKGGAPQGHDSILYNSQGLVTYRLYLPVNALPVQDVFTYDAAGHLIKDVTSSFGMQTTNYSWTGDNMGDNGSATFGYYTDKAISTGDYFESDQLMQFGRVAHTIKNANLLKTTHALGGSVITYDYTFDADGKITKITLSSAGISAGTYDNMTYDCK